MRNFAAFSSWFCIFQVSFHAFETVKTAIFVGLGLANFTLVAKIGVEERHVTRFQLRSMTDVVFARFGGCLVSLLDG